MPARKNGGLNLTALHTSQAVLNYLFEEINSLFRCCSNSQLKLAVLHTPALRRKETIIFQKFPHSLQDDVLLNN